MKLLIGVALLCTSILFTGCTTVACRFQKSAVQRVSDTIATALQCKNSDAVYEDLSAVMSKLSPCKQVQGKQGPIAEAVCPTISKWVTEVVVNQAVPSSWQCDPTVAKSMIVSKVEAVCRMLPVEER